MYTNFHVISVLCNFTCNYEVVCRNKNVHSSLSLIRSRNLVAAFMDLPYISRSSAVRPNLQTPALSSPPHPSPKNFLSSICLFGFSVLLLVLLSPVFGVSYMSEKLVSFLLKFSSVPDVTPTSLAMDWSVLCPVHDTCNFVL